MNDLYFRIAFLVVLALVVPVGIYHRLRAAAGGRVSHKEEGYLFAVVLRLAGVGLWTAAFAYLFFPTTVQWATLPVPAWIRWIGVAIGGLCSLLMYWTLASLGNNLTDTVATRLEATLVTHGPYRWVRHPFYVTASLLMASVTLLTANWLFGLGSLLVLALLAARTPKEEQMLVNRFGQDYQDYMLRTGRFIPRFHRRGS